MARTPTLGWICTDPLIAAKARATLDVSALDAMRAGTPGSFPTGHRSGSCAGGSGYTGHIGGANVIVDCLPQPARAADAARAARALAADCDAVMLVGYGCSVRTEVRLGDLVISRGATATATATGTGTATNAGTNAGTNTNPPNTNPPNIDPPNIALRAVDVLRAEVGSAGFWLASNLPPDRPNPEDTTPSSPHLHYGNIGPRPPDDDGGDAPGEDRDMLCFETDVADMGAGEWPTPLVVVAVTGRFRPRVHRDASFEQAAANAVGYLVELARLASELTADAPTLASLEGTEATVRPACAELPLAPFAPYAFPPLGDVVLLVVPSANAAKARLLHDAVRAQAPPGVSVLLETTPFDSGVGEQPYNDEGLVGAHNRVANALRALDAPHGRRGLAQRRVGTVLVASIENFIRTTSSSSSTGAAAAAAGRPVDYGLVVVYNASVRRAATRLSAGVSVPPAYVRRARRFGSVDHRDDCGVVTVGQVLAARVPGLDKANWHTVLAGVSRYDLLRAAAAQLRIPW